MAFHGVTFGIARSRNDLRSVFRAKIGPIFDAVFRRFRYSAFHLRYMAFRGVTWRYMLFAVAADALRRVVGRSLALYLALLPVRDSVVHDQPDFAHDLNHAGHRF